MNKLKVCFIGVGSIAKRHIRNLQTICNERKIEITMDAFRRSPEMVDGIENIYCAESELPDNYDIIFITNPTELHFHTLKEFHDKGRHFFIEKPVVSLTQIEEAKRFQTRENSVYYVACPLRYNAVIQWIRENVNLGDIISVRSISSSYLPDWRPGQDYRNTYSAHKALGGGVSIDLIHEWDYLTFLLGWPKTVYSLSGKKSALEIDSDDYAIYIADYDDKIVELHLDYFGRSTVREMQLFTKNETIIGDIYNNKIVFMSSGEIKDFCEERDDYQKRELEYFMNLVMSKNYHSSGYHNGLKLLELSQGII